MIRKATLGDMPGIYVLGRRIHMKSDDRDIPMDEAKVRVTVATLIDSKNGLVLVDEVDGLITGVLLGFCDDLWYSKRRYAMPLVIYAERGLAFVGMLKRFLKWAFEQKCAVQVPLDCSFGGPLGDKTVKLMRKLCERERRWLIEEVGASFSVRKHP